MTTKVLEDGSARLVPALGAERALCLRVFDTHTRARTCTGVLDPPTVSALRALSACLQERLLFLLSSRRELGARSQHTAVAALGQPGAGRRVGGLARAG